MNNKDLVKRLRELWKTMDKTRLTVVEKKDMELARIGMQFTIQSLEHNIFGVDKQTAKMIEAFKKIVKKWNVEE